jgi:NAD(P)H-dependent FMN reductase
MKLHIILGSTRNGRNGEQVAKWLNEKLQKKAQESDAFEVEFLDLKEWDLPMYQEPFSDKAEDWKKKISEADGYIIVTPEYNHGYPAVLKNALDYPYAEWNKKAVGFVAYSDGMSAGIRSVEQLRLVCIQLQLAPIRQAMYFPNIEEAFADDTPKDPATSERLDTFLEELLWWTRALKTARDI